MKIKPVEGLIKTRPQEASHREVNVEDVNRGGKWQRVPLSCSGSPGRVPSVWPAVAGF